MSNLVLLNECRKGARKHQARHIEEYIDQIFNALPGAGEQPIDYEAIRGRVSVGLITIKQALKIMVVDGRAVAVKGGLRGRKVFRRAELSHVGENAAAAVITTPANSAITTSRQVSSITNLNTA